MIKSAVRGDGAINDALFLAAGVCVDGASSTAAAGGGDGQEVNGLALRTLWESLGRGIVR